ncbi:hypothetical protein [Peribacillus asahii]|uniref:hypothetical protein n=1 Tax=Peribacillus asahii TaxID=228899 RepID=UPI00338FB96F
MKQVKRVNIVSVKLVKEASLLYKGCRISSPEDSYEIIKKFLAEMDREHFIVMCLDTCFYFTLLSNLLV